MEAQSPTPFMCQRCGFQTTTAPLLKSHLQRKRVCHPTLSNITLDELYKALPKNGPRAVRTENGTYPCHYCKKEYRSNAAKSVHQRKCEKEYQKTFESLQKQIDEIKNKPTPPPVKHFKLVPFGSENVSVEECMELVKKDPFGPVIQNLVAYVHFNDDKPENKNIICSNLHDPYFKIHNGSKFIVEKKSKVSSEWINKYTDMMLQHSRMLNLSAEDDVKFTDRVNLLKRDKKLRSQTHTGVVKLCYNFQV